MVRTESLLAHVFDNPKDVVIVTDEFYNIRYVSSSVESIFGVKPFFILGKNGFEFVPENKREEWRRCLEEANGNRSSEINLFTSNGDELHFDVTVTNHTSHHEIKGMVILLHDVTERRLAHERLEKANHQLDHFIFKTIHDLRAPIHSALGLVNLGENLDPAEAKKYLSLVRGSLLKLEAFIDEVSDFYKNDKLAIQREEIDLQNMLMEEVESLKSLPEARDIKIDYFVDSDTAFFSDPLRVKTVLTNILTNSVKYRDDLKSTKFIFISAKVFNDKVFLTIEDNGIGIEEEHQSRVFDMFFRANTHTRGTGLGLYIVKDTVERLGGTILLNSKVAMGTTFTITLPNMVNWAIDKKHQA